VRFSVRKRDGTELAALDTSNRGFSLREPTALKDLSVIAIQNAGNSDINTALVLQLSVAGTAMPLDVPIALQAGRRSNILQDAVKFGPALALQELIDHLMANRMHYSQAVFRSLDAATLGTVLAGFTYRGIPASQLVDSQPIASTANYLVFKVNVTATGDAEDARWAPEQDAWRKWLKLRGLDRPAPKSEIIPLPSGGVFAEAVLGRFNAAEKMDLTRFWNWQDSPIPITAPDIAPLQAGGRAQSDEIRPGQLSQPVLSIQQPTALPDPAGVTAIINAIQQGNMFRDMSGLAQTAALAQAGVQASAAGATAAGEQAANTLATVMANNTERMRIAAELLASTGGLSGLGGGPKPPGKGTVSERGGELNAAQEVGAELDQSLAADGGQANGSGGAEASLASLSPGKQFRVTQFRQQFAGSGAVVRVPHVQPQKNIYVAPDSASARDAVKFVVDFVNDFGSSVDKGDKMVEIRASGGQLAWSQQFPVSLGGVSVGQKQQTRVVSAKLWNDQTFEYTIFAGIEFVSPRQGDPVKTFFSKSLTFKVDPGRGGTIRLRMVLKEEQHQSGMMQPTQQAKLAAVNALRALYPRLGVSGINEGMVTEIITSRNTTTNQINLSFFYLTGDVKLEVAPKPKP
jgi:hypothetical protein